MATVAGVILSTIAMATVCLMVEGSLPCSEYYIGEQGQTCQDVCAQRDLACSTKIETGGNMERFTELGINCIADTRELGSVSSDT